MPPHTETSNVDHLAGNPSLVRNLALVLLGTFTLSLLSLALPDIALDTTFADTVTRLTDTATWSLMPFLAVAVLIVLVSRPGLSSRQRATEAMMVIAAMLVVLVGNSLLNENVTKPIFAIPRPNIETLADSGALGPEFPDAEAFYAVGDKGVRREVLGELLPTLETPPLSDSVRAHWIHETGYSFPSGHSTAAITLATMMAALALVAVRGWRLAVFSVLLPIWAVLVVYSRVMLEVHTAIDVIAGTMVGFCWGLLAFTAIRTMSKRLTLDAASKNA